MADYLSVANYLMLLSNGGHMEVNNYIMTSESLSDRRVFECQTCKRQFPSFQALGGHRASHKKPRIIGDEPRGSSPAEAKLPKIHKCSICGLEFGIGQALGGHMRRHKDGGGATAKNKENHPDSIFDLFPQVVKTASRRRVLGLDLNLTPLENDFQFQHLG